MSPRPNPLDALRGRADAFATGPEMTGVLSGLLDDTELRARAERDPAVVLREAGIRLPKALGIKFAKQPKASRPVPGYEFFSIRLTRCRTVWVADEPGGKPKEQTVCFGFEIVPNPPPGGPIG
jgi:hypothetical protein